MAVHVRRFGNPEGTPVVCVAGFADHGGMYEPLGVTDFGDDAAIIAVDLPGTGEAPPVDEPLTLALAARLIAEVVRQERASILIGHSVASIIVSLAARDLGSEVRTVASLEGNLTPPDGYFSASAASYDTPAQFHAGLLDRLHGLGADDPVVQRYRRQVEIADPRSIWELGCDVAAWSVGPMAGEVLASCAEQVHYLYNPDNMPAESLAWLDQSALATVRLDGASHWAVVDEPQRMAQVLSALVV